MAARTIHLYDGTGYTACCGKAWSSLGLGAPKTEDPEEVTCPEWVKRLEGLRQREGDQPLPVPQPDVPDVQTAVIRDIVARRELGISRYGTPLQPHNGRDALRDLYEELLDGAMYARQLMLERDSWVDSRAELEAENARLRVALEAKR